MAAEALVDSEGSRGVLARELIDSFVEAVCCRWMLVPDRRSSAVLVQVICRGGPHARGPT